MSPGGTRNLRITVRRCVVVAAVVLVGATGHVVGAVSPPVASAADCPDAEVIFARGTDEPEGMGRVGDAFVASLRRRTAGLTIRTYAVDYKASKLQLHGGDGAKDVISRIASTVASCPGTQIVLGGYSQGASVIDIVAGVPVAGISWGSPLPAQYVDDVAAVATFGNVADRGGSGLSTQSALLGAKAIDLCNPGDPICHAGPGNSWSGHTEGYVPEYTDQAASFAATALWNAWTPTTPAYGPDLPTAHGPQPGYGSAPVYGSPPVYGMPDPSAGADVVGVPHMPDQYSPAAVPAA